MKYFLPFMVIAMCLFGCKKDNNSLPSIAGKWELRQEVGGASNINEGFAAGNGNIYQFNSDGTYAQYINTDSLIAKGTYTIKAKAETDGGVTYNDIYFNGSSTGSVVQVVGTTLTLGIDYDDKTATIYAKLD